MTTKPDTSTPPWVIPHTVSLNSPEMQEMLRRDQLRGEYFQRRWNELRAQGVQNPWPTIETEIEAGLALQQQPVRITRTRGSA